MTVTAEQAKQAKDIILDCLKTYPKYQVPFREVRTQLLQNFDDIPFLHVWVIYDAEPGSLDARMLNSFDPYVFKKLRKAGIHAIPSISYVPQSEADQLDASWIG